MPFEDSLIGNNDFDPRAATESLIRQVSDLPPGGPVDVRALNTRLARKLGQPTPAPIEEPEPVEQGPADFSAQAAPPPPTDVTDTSLDFSSQAAMPSPVDMPPAPPSSLSDYPVEAGKSFVRNAKDMGASSLKGTAALGIPTPADPALLEQLAVAPTMTPRQRAELMGTVLRGVSDRGLQMDYNAALRRIAQGADPTVEIAALRPKFDANNMSATQPITEKPLYKAGQAIEDFGKDALKNKPGFEPGKSYTTDIAGGAGSMVTGIAIGLIPGIGPAASGALFTTSGSGEAVDKAVENKATTQQIREAARWGGVAGATDMADNLLPMLGTTGKVLGFVKRVGIAAVKGAMVEGGQEGVQQLMQNAIAKGIYKPDQDLSEDVPRSMLIAAILGGMGGGISGAAHRGGDPAASTPAAPAAPGATDSGPGTPPPGGPQSSPEDIADFVRQAKEGAPPQPEPGPAPAADPSTMSDAERTHAYTASRESHGGASETDILKAAGLDPATMDEQERIDAVIRAAKPAESDATSNATGNAQAKPEHSSEQPQAKQPDAASHQEYAVLREYGYSDEDIANMGAKQRAREVKDAGVNGIDPAKAMQKHKMPAPEAADTTASKNTTEQPASATTSSPDKVVSEPGDGTRTAPISAATADDVLKAKPADPTEAQATAENYRHSHVDLPQLGLTGKSNISIETGVGQERKGVSPDGKPWSVTLEHAAYGRIKGTKGADGEPLDIFIGPHPTSPHVFIVDQHHQTGGFDEHKILAGFRTPIDAMHAYANSYTDGAKDRIGHVTAMSPEEFRAWLGGDTTKALKPASAEPSKAAEAGQHATETDAGTLAVPKEPSTTEAHRESHSIISNPSSPPAAQKRDNKARSTSDEPLSLLQFIASKGGLAPHPELDALDIGDHRVHIPGRKGFFGVIRPTGMSLDLMREAAEESGYLRGEHNKTSTIRNLLDAMDGEKNRGQPLHAEGEEGKTTKRQRTSAAESSAAARDQGIQANREAIAAEYVDLPDDLLEQAATIMADEMLDLDSAVEMAAVRAVNEDADYEVTPNDIADTFGEGAIDAIRAEGTSEDGGHAPPASGQERQSDQGEEAGEHGERVPPARAEGREGEEVVSPIESFPGPDGMEARIYANTDGKTFNVTLFDTDSGETVPTIKVVQTIEKAREIATKLVSPTESAGKQTVLPPLRELAPAQAKAIWGNSDRHPEWAKNFYGSNRESNVVYSRGPIALLEGLHKIAPLKGQTYYNGIKNFGTNVGSAAPDIRDYKGDIFTSEEKAELVVAANRLANQSRLIDATPAGEQTTIPGTEPIGDGELAQRKADTGLKPKVAQKPTDVGLFGDEMDQADLLDAAKPTGIMASLQGREGETYRQVMATGKPAEAAELFARAERYADDEGVIGRVRRVIRTMRSPKSGLIDLEHTLTQLRGTLDYIERESAHTDAIETALGDDADKVAPVDIARAAELMAENEGMDVPTAFGQAVIETAVDQGFITEQQAEESYGPEVKNVLDTGRQGASGGSAHLEQGGAESGEVGAGGAAEAGVVSRRGEAGEGIEGGGVEASQSRGDDTTAASDTAEQQAAGGEAAQHQPAAQDANNADLTENQKLFAEMIREARARFEANPPPPSTFGDIGTRPSDLEVRQNRLNGERKRDADLWWRTMPDEGRADVMSAIGRSGERVKRMLRSFDDATRAEIEAYRDVQMEAEQQSIDEAKAAGVSAADAPTWAEILHQLPMVQHGKYSNRDTDLAFRLISEITGTRSTAYNDLTPGQKVELLARLKGDSVTPTETSDGISPPVHGSDASSESKAVPPTAGQRGVGSTRGAESSGSEPDVSGDHGGQAEDAAGGTGSGGTGQGDAVRVSGRPESAEGGRSERPAKREAGAVKGENYRIEPGALAEDRGPKRKAEDNLNAIMLSNIIEKLGRPATLDEQHKLARYVGWGGLKNAFPDASGEFAKGFETIGHRLKLELTPEEYDTARRSIQYAHYTAEDVINGMWDIAERLGFKGGHVFEPGMGVGHFAGLMPADVAEHTTYNGVEMDHVTARIAGLLYPKWGVRREDFTKMPLAENAFDLVIGNPPFADIAIQSDPKYAKQGFLLHDYFFAKSLDGVRPGGVLAFVTSAGTMNKLDPSARNYLADRADFVGAVRLPSNAFKKNAGTEVTTDIVILRKRLPGEAVGDRTWTETAEVTLPGPDGKPMKGQINRYFAEHPEMVLGKGDFADKLYEGRYSVKAWDGFDLKDALAVAIGKLPRNVMSEPETQQDRAEADFEGTEKKDGSYYIKDGKLMQQRAGAGYEVERRGKGVEGGKTAAELERIRGLVPIRDALRETFAADLADDAEAGKRARGRLNKAYDAFVAKFGPINKAEIQKRRPNSIQEEAARAEAREEARYAGQMFDEGSFDASRMDGRSLTEISRARKAAIAEQGERYRSGDFDPDLMPDVIIDKRPNIDPFIDDQESYRLRAMEHYDEPTGKAEKRDVFFKNVISKDRPPEIKSVNDAALYVLNQKGMLDLDAIGALVGKSRTETIEALGDRIYQVPSTQETFETAEKYLSGNVRKKLAIAKAAAEKNPVFRRNVAALDAAQPAPLAPSQIGASLGMPWIPTDVVEQFATEALGLEKLKAHYSPAIASWSVSGDTDSLAATSTWGTSRRNATALMLDALNRQNPKIYDQIDKDTRVLNAVATQAAQEKMQAIRDKFNEWIFSDEKRADRLAGFYNENYNNLVVQEFNGDYLTTPGISSDWTWRPHQKRVIARIIQNGNTYVAHAVGAGKTSVYIGAGMEMRRLGLVKKPAYAVPNHMLAQFTKEFYEQYPTARIMVADERQFHTDRRKQFMANVAMSDLDAVIITHSAFAMIPVSDEFQDSIIQDELNEYRRALADMPKNQDNRITRSRIEKQIERLEQRLSGKSNRKRDAVFTFDEMGIDFLFVDEAHDKYRKLDFSTQMSNLKGITPQGNSYAWDLYVKSKLLEKRNPGRSLVLGSGTPITNTMAELFTVSRYLQPGELRERQLQQFDAWAGAFGENVTELEQDAAGGYKPVSRFAKFVNVAELSVMVRQVMDVVTSRQLEQYVVRPKLKGGKRVMNLAEKSPALDRYMASLSARMKAMEGRGKPKPGDDIMLKVIGDGRHAAIDMRLVGADKNDADHPSKLDLLVENVAKLHKSTKTQKFYRPKNGAYDMSKPADTGPATQMVFVNLGISGSRGFSVPDYIRAELVRRGVPRTEIALIADYKSHVAKQKLFNDMNEGKVRVLIGSTAKMATGVNAQRRLYSVHNMDPLWYPSDDEQRNGRALRQGNMNPEIEIHDYSTKGTYDSTMWGMMEKKARFIQGFFEGDPSLRSMDDLGEASQYEQAKALTTNDPRLMRLTELRQELEKANRRKSAFDNDRYAVRRRRIQAEDDIEHYGAREISIEKDIAQRVSLAGDAFVAKIGRETFDKRVDFGEALLTVLDKISTPANSGRHMPIGEISGFSLVATPQKIVDHMAVNVDMKRNGGAESHVTVGTSGLGAVRSMESIIGGFDHDLAHVREKIKAARKLLKDSETDAAKTFTGGADMDALATEIRELQTELAKKEETQPPPPPEEEGLASAMRAGDLTQTAAENIPVIEGMLASIVKKLAGNSIDVSFNLGGIPVQNVGGYGDIHVTEAAGIYYPHRSLIRLALYGGAEDVARTAFHESYHAIEDRFQTPAERELMRRETTRLREFLKRKRHKGYTVAEIDKLADYEVRAMAFEHYAYERAGGATHEQIGEGIHIGARRWFERLWDALRALANGLRGLGFRTYEDIFERAFNGEYAQREPGPSGGIDLGGGLASAIPPGGGRRGPPPVNETIAELLNNHNFDKLAGISKLLRFGNINATELRVRLQDRFIRVKKAEDSVGGVPTSQSAYIAETLYYGRTGQQLEALERNELDPLVEDMKGRDIGLEEINEYLYAKHAPERNAAMDAINHPDLGIGGRDLRGRGSGMSDEEAQAIMDRITAAGRIADFEAVERRVRKIIDDSREQLVDSGLISQETADAWAEQYEFYVPLQGFEEGTEDETMQSRGQGYDTRAGETKRAFGRLSRADGPLPYIMQQAELAIVRGEKNKVGNAWLRFVRSHPDPTRWTVDTPKLKKAIDPRTGLVTTVQDTNWHNDPDLFVTKVGGRPVLIRMEGTAGRNLVRALKNLGTENVGEFLRLVRGLTVTMARLNTQWNPNFVVPNFVRDLGEAYINLQEQDQKHFIRQFSKHIIPSIRGSFNALRGNEARPGSNQNIDVYTRAFHEFDAAGGRIRFFGIDSAVDVEKSIAARLRRLDGGAINNIRDAGRALADGFEAVNGAIENATRLAAYMAARDVGMTAPDAAALARNLTVDFNKKGELGPAMNSLFMFSNVAFQGSRRTLKALSNKYVRRAAYTLIALGALSAMLAYGAGGDDDSGESYYSRVKDWERDKNLVIMWPKGFGHDGEFKKIMLPFGFAMFKVLGDRLAGVAMGRDKPGDALTAILKSIGDSFSPLGEEGGTILSPLTLLPSIVRPAAHIQTNKNWNGNPLYPEYPWEKNKPESEQSFRSNSAFAKGAAREINKATGGSPYKSGWADLHPGSIDHVLESLTGGLGKFVKDVVVTGGRIAKGDEFDPTKAPIIRRFVGSVNTPDADASTYYERREEARKNGGDAIRNARKDRSRGINVDDANSFLSDNTNSTRGEGIFKRADAQMKPLRADKSRIEASDSYTDQQRKELDRITQKMRDIQNTARKEYRKLKAEAGDKQLITDTTD